MKEERRGKKEGKKEREKERKREEALWWLFKKKFIWLDNICQCL